MDSVNESLKKVAQDLLKVACELQTVADNLNAGYAPKIVAVPVDDPAPTIVPSDDDDASAPGHEDLIREEIQSFIDENKLFSAWDITQTLRNLGYTVYHSDVRRVLRDMFDNGELPYDYTRTSVVLNAGVDTWVYHLTNVDPVTEYYASEDYIALTAVAPKSTCAKSCCGSTTVTANTGTCVSININPDARGRLCIRKDHLTDLGLGVGDMAYLVFGNDAITITADEPAFSDRVLAIDDSGNLRISSGTLVKGGLLGGSYTVTVKNGEIVIE